MTPKAPTYLVQIEDKLYGYWYRSLLIIDILQNKQEPTAIYEINKGGLTLSYKKITFDDINGDGTEEKKKEEG